MKAVKNLLLMFALVFAASSSYAQEVKPIKHHPETKVVSKRQSNQVQRQSKTKKLNSDLQQSKLKPVKIESRLYNESN